MDKLHTDVVLPPAGGISGDSFARCHPLSFHGRIGRLRWLARCTPVLLLYLYGLPFLTGTLPTHLMDSPQLIYPLSADTALPLLPLVLIVLAFLLLLLFSAQRLRDLGLPGWLGLLLLTPANPGVLIMLLFLAGNAGANVYGLPATPNNAKVYLLLSLWPLLALFLWFS